MFTIGSRSSRIYPFVPAMRSCFGTTIIDLMNDNPRPYNPTELQATKFVLLITCVGTTARQDFSVNMLFIPCLCYRGDLILVPRPCFHMLQLLLGTSIPSFCPGLLSFRHLHASLIRFSDVTLFSGLPYCDILQSLSENFHSVPLSHSIKWSTQSIIVLQASLLKLISKPLCSYTLSSSSLSLLSQYPPPLQH
jgi:hypothetical protein